MSKKFDELFREIVTILRRDYAGAELVGDRFDPRYYNQSIGQAWHDGQLTELLFLRYVSQMFACTGDRRLRLTMRPTESYTPWSCGFFTRRYGDALYVTALVGETRLAVGDRIDTLNGAPPSHHRALIQKNFLYADDPEREDWSGLLRMAQFIGVCHADGTRESLELERHPQRAPGLAPELRVLDGGIVYLRPGVFDGETALPEMPDEYAALILDLRGARGGDEDAARALLPLLCREDTPASALFDTEIYENYTRLNCILKAAAIQGMPGAEAYTAELRARAGSGLTREALDEPDLIPGRAPRAAAVLTDTWCRDAGETLALAAKRAGAYLIGRPTLGTIGLCGDVSMELDERYVFTWPTAVAAPVNEGARLPFEGVAPDRYVPWTPRELAEDVLLAEALGHLKGQIK